MVISSNALFHFTQSKEDLLCILENGFRPRYCLEDLSPLYKAGDGATQVALPMTCFCDLPLSQLGEHVKYYGNYGIGMKKEWGITNGLNPVLYLHSQSDLARMIADKMDSAPLKRERNPFLVYYELLNHIKLYDGFICRGTKQQYKRFYDEKEWRWVPLPYRRDWPEKCFLSEAEYANPRVRREANRQLAQVSQLSFGPEDIKYIIVASEAEILPVINRIELAKERYDLDMVKLLAAKIISVEQIRADF